VLPPDHSDVGNDGKLLDFNQLSEHLIAGAASANADRDIGNDDDKPPVTVLAPPLRITIPPLNSATLSHRATLVMKTSIPLKILFKYPAATDLPLDESRMNSFWRGGIQNLEKEMEAYELLSLSKENLDVINPGDSNYAALRTYVLTFMSISMFYSLIHDIGRIVGHGMMPDMELSHRPLTHHDLSNKVKSLNDGSGCDLVRPRS
jgi:hypothetical protein